MAGGKTIASLETDPAAHPDVATAKLLTLQLMALVDVYSAPSVVSACVTTAAMLLAGRPLRQTDVDLLAITERFIRDLDAARDVLREDATTIVPAPKGVM